MVTEWLLNGDSMGTENTGNYLHELPLTNCDSMLMFMMIHWHSPGSIVLEMTSTIGIPLNRY